MDIFGKICHLLKPSLTRKKPNPPEELPAGFFLRLIYLPHVFRDYSLCS
ncbi:hypothetical protein CHK_2998 [Christensenella hongkongensis]|uniref:Uncharacterized protein n=1 Tax=Christensenella hongkongensis TaxID=270498 RepID=A0A0M2NGL0_9FIRM|nr:hypothetical protein CHK_2998 [Christensenella hongkongensis]